MRLLTVAEAEALILATVTPSDTEVIPISQAGGRILRETIVADRDYPPIHRATMDGIAIASASWQQGVRSWNIERIAAAGSPSPELSDPHGGCVHIMTGAQVPDNADGIIPVELVHITETTATVTASTSMSPGQYIHRRGIDRQTGSILLTAGHRLDAPRIAIMASVGHHEVRVATPPRVTILSTGNEIVPIDQRHVTPTQVRASNLMALETALRLNGVGAITTRHIADDLDTTINAVQTALDHDDILILSGGVSMGKFDHVPTALSTCGVEKIFHRVAQKPGKPFWFGRTNRCHVFGLPGNPVSTLTVMYRYVTPYLQASLQVRPDPVPHIPLITSMPPHRELTLFAPVSLVQQHGGNALQPLPHHGSGDFSALAESAGFAEIPPGENTLDAGTPLPFYRW